MPHVDKGAMMRCLTEIEMCAHDARQALCHAEHFAEEAQRSIVLTPGQANGKSPNQQARELSARSAQGVQVSMGRMLAYAGRLEGLLSRKGEELDGDPPEPDSPAIVAT